jgi:hypothetical protein
MDGGRTDGAQSREAPSCPVPRPRDREDAPERADVFRTKSTSAQLTGLTGAVNFRARADRTATARLVSVSVYRADKKL